jgi:hypothetical protein
MTVKSAMNNAFAACMADPRFNAVLLVGTPVKKHFFGAYVTRIVSYRLAIDPATTTLKELSFLFLCFIAVTRSLLLVFILVSRCSFKEECRGLGRTSQCEEAAHNYLPVLSLGPFAACFSSSPSHGLSLSTASP